MSQPAISRVLAAYIKKAGYDCVVFAGGDEAIEQFATLQPALISDRAVDNAIKRLRKALLHLLPEEAEIRTFRGTGDQFYANQNP